VSTPTPSLTIGAIRLAANGPTVPVRWGWRVVAPSLRPGAAAVMTSATATALAKAVSTVWTPWTYRASTPAPDGTVVTALGRAQARYASQVPSSVSIYSKGWVAVAARTAVGGAVRATKTLGATVVMRVNARNVGLLLQRGPSNGAVAIYVDGRLVAQVNLRATVTSTRVAWTKNFGVKGAHTITLRNVTGGVRGALGYNGVVSLI